MTKIIGHRGARGLAPENTVKAIEVALSHHVDGVEIDVRVTRDGIVILSHDPTIKELRIHETTYAALKERKPDLATLEEVLTKVRGHGALWVEIKPHEPVAPIAHILRQELAVHKKADITVLSRSFSILKQIRTELPEVPIALNERWSSIRARWRMRRLGINRLQMNQLWLWRGFLWAMHRNGIHLTPYAVNSPARAARWNPYIDGIITDYPDRFERR